MRLFQSALRPQPVAAPSQLHGSSVTAPPQLCRSRSTAAPTTHLPHWPARSRGRRPAVVRGCPLPPPPLPPPPPPPPPPGSAAGVRVSPAGESHSAAHTPSIVDADEGATHEPVATTPSGHAAKHASVPADRARRSERGQTWPYGTVDGHWRRV